MVLCGVTIPIEEIIGSGGGETKGTQRLRKALAATGWHKVNFVVEKTINGVRKESQSHEVDHVRTFLNGVVALECPASALVRQNWRLEEGRISGSS